MFEAFYDVALQQYERVFIVVNYWKQINWLDYANNDTKQTTARQSWFDLPNYMTRLQYSVDKNILLVLSNYGQSSSIYVF